MTTRRIRAREAWVGYALLLPAMVAFGVFAFYPLVKVVQLGLYRVPPFPGLPSHYAGLSQYGSVLRSSSFLQALWNTVLFVLFTVPVGIAVGLALATLAHKELKGMRVFRTIFSSTVATSTAVAGLIFFTLLDPEVGLVSYWLGERGGSGLLGSPTFALPALSVATIWQGIGFTFIITSAALQSLPEDVLEAALVDGSAGWHR
ncbi:MAG TPA: sugar ABC transporter permease, partial [Acidimicrobiales bacterium]|nr:sugar ABC transporter permease [Acidimicrobiales bacterium]